MQEAGREHHWIDVLDYPPSPSVLNWCLQLLPFRAQTHTHIPAPNDDSLVAGHDLDSMASAHSTLWYPAPNDDSLVAGDDMDSMAGAYPVSGCSSRLQRGRLTVGDDLDSMAGSAPQARRRRIGRSDDDDSMAGGGPSGGSLDANDDDEDASSATKESSLCAWLCVCV